MTLAWDPSTGDDIAGYTLMYGTTSGVYPQQINVGNTTAFTVSSLPNGTYYFVVQAYSSSGLASPASNQVVVTLGTTIITPLPSQPVSTCSTPDPFASLGGGTCYNSDWLPPGMVPPNSSPAPAPAPAPAPTVASLSGTSCTTSDPFASLGGGACYNGSWLPPGMVPPASSPAPAPAPAPGPPPTAPVAPSSGTSCSTPDPFAALGRGTCYNGGWLPPGMPIPGWDSPTPAPATAPETPPTAPSAGCQTPDPFEALGGGTCFNGDWLPAGMEITVTGTLHAVSLEEGLWMIEAEDGTLYTPSTAFIEQNLADGAVVTFHALTLPSSSEVDGIFVVEIFEIYLHQ